MQHAACGMLHAACCMLHAACSKMQQNAAEKKAEKKKIN
jgi:hypothetical protein